MFAEFSLTDPGLDELLIVLFNIGNLLAVIAFVVRGPILLRVLAVVGTGMQAFFYAFISEGPIVYGVFWKILMAAAAFGFMLVLLRERMGRQFAVELRDLAQELSLLNPGQIEKLFKVGEVRDADGQTHVLHQGQRPSELFYLLKGSAKVVKDGLDIPIRDGTFLGEIAFVSGGDATADVFIEPGSKYLAWSTDKLSELLKKDDQIDIALRGLINHDLARKVASQPVRTTGTQEAQAAE